MLTQASGELVGRGNDALGGFAGRQRADVGGQVGERDVDLVADGRDGRDARRGDRPDDGFLVERPQVFEAAAAAADDQHVRRGLESVRGADAGDDLGDGAVALHARRDDEHVDAAPASPQHFEKITDGRAGGTGDERDPFGNTGKRRLRAGSKSPSAESFSRSLRRASSRAPTPFGSSSSTTSW